MNLGTVIAGLLLFLLLLALSFRRGSGDRSQFPTQTRPGAGGGGGCLLDIPPPDNLEIVQTEDRSSETDPLLSSPIRGPFPGGEVEKPRA